MSTLHHINFQPIHGSDWIILDIDSHTHTKIICKRSIANNKYFPSYYYGKSLLAIIIEFFHMIYTAISNGL